MQIPVPATDIRDVLLRLDRIIADARAESSRLGWFAALYRRVTQAVADGIRDGRFDDGARMDRLDTDFANRYFAALAAKLRGEPVPKAWGYAFSTARYRAPLVLQHLLLGMNAHINVDLGAAAAAVCPGPALPGLESDFNRINELLASLVNDVQRELAAVSPGIGDLDRLGGGADEKLAVFSMDHARAEAWRLARTIDRTPAILREYVHAYADSKAYFLGRLLAHPPEPVATAVRAIRARETDDVVAVLDVLDVRPGNP